MPLPRKKDAGGSGAPVLDILNAHVRLIDVEEHTEPYTITRKSDGATFKLDPQFSCTAEVVDDGQDGSDNGARFFEGFRYKQSKDGGWFNLMNSKLGALSEVLKPGYFEDDTIPDLEASDLEGFEMLCRIKPKKNPSGQVTGSTIEWDTMRSLPKRAPRPATVLPAQEGVDEDSSDDLPF
jgi:hypothetical protein